MGTPIGSPTQRVIGVGKRADKNGKVEDVTNFYPNFYNNVVAAFEYYPITEVFGITPEDAMDMPVDRWYRIKNVSMKIAEERLEKPDTNLMLIEYIKKLTEALGGE